MRAILRRLFHRYAVRMATSSDKVVRLDPIPVAQMVRAFEGNWVAIKNGEVVQAAETPGLLSLRLKEGQIRNATIVRARRHDETELVGLG